jgi:hypothetical protein
MNKARKDYKNKKKKSRLKRKMENRIDGTYSYYPSGKV